MDLVTEEIVGFMRLSFVLIGFLGEGWSLIWHTHLLGDGQKQCSVQDAEMSVRI
jgi:hypothetical protein